MKVRLKIMDEDMKLMNETLGSAYEYIDKIINAVGNMVYNLQGGREDKAIAVCSDLFEGIRWLIECFSLTAPLQSSKGIMIDTSEINPVNLQIEEALENRDYVLLGDLLDYEMMPIVNEWKTQIGQILKSE